MVRKLVLITAVLLGPQALAVDTSVPDRVDTLATIQSDTTMDDARLTLAKSIVNNMVVDKTPDEILAMVNEIALALSDQDLCGPEALQAMLDVDIPFDPAFDSIVKVCKLSGPELAALSRSLAPGIPPGQGGPGPLVSP